MFDIYNYFYKTGQKIFGGSRFSKFRFFRQIKKYLYAKTQPEFVEMKWAKLYLDSAEGIRPKSTGEYQEAVADIFKRELRNGDVIVDLGADIGYFTCLAASLVGDSGKVFAFEPSPRSVKILIKNIEVNEIKTAVIVPKAVSDKEGRLALFERGPHSSLGFNRDNASVETARVDVITLDNFFADFNKPISLIKMDMIGSEAKAFRGMKKVLERNKDVKLIIASAPRDLKMAGCDPEIFLGEIADAGFNIYEVYNNMKPIGRNEFGELVSRCSPKTGSGILIMMTLFCKR